MSFQGEATADLCAQVTPAIKADITIARIRERLQVLEAWKLDADSTELQLIREHEHYLNYLLDDHHVPTDMHEPYWFERRRLEGDYDR